MYTGKCDDSCAAKLPIQDAVLLYFTGAVYNK